MPSFPLALPGGFRIVSSTFGLDSHSGLFRSAFSEKSTVSERNAGTTSRWAGSYSITGQTLAEAAELIAFLAALRGAEGSFLAFDPDRKTPSTKNGSFPGSGTVNGGGQSGRMLNTDGWPANALILRAGDLIQVGDQLLEIASDATTDNSGLVALAFEPALRSSPPDGESVVTDQPVMRARMKNSSFFHETGPAKSNLKTLEFEEVI